MRFTILTFSFYLLIVGCNSQKLSEKINGVWIFEKEINDLNINDSSTIFTQRPILFDFQKNNKLQIKNYAFEDNLTSWNFKTDSILIFDNKEYNIHSIDTNSLILIDYNRPDTYWLFFKRPKDVKISLSKDEIYETLTSKVWSIQDSTKNIWKTNFQYYNNGTVIYRYKMYDRNFKDTLDNLQLETWGIDEYKNYFFIYSYMDMMLGNGNYDEINQIINFSEESYSIRVTTSNNELTEQYINRNQKDIRKNIKGKLIGSWESKNSIEKIYSRKLSERVIENGIMNYFQGKYLLNISDQEIAFSIDELEPLKSNFQISIDGKIIIMEHQIDEPEIKGIHVIYADILELNDSILKLKLYDSQFYTGHKNPERYLLNIIQEFKKVN